jgi:ABC-type uncharacterized transport system fused permease/ATPase subunit
MMRKVIDFLKRTDAFVEEKSLKVPFFIFDTIVILVSSIAFIWGLILMFTWSFSGAVIFVMVVYAICAYLLIKRHKKHFGNWL